MTFSWNQALLDQTVFAWDYVFTKRVSGLTDDEYLWEPVDGCWSVCPADDGTWQQELVYPDPQPPPFTTIAWRLAHIGAVFGQRASKHFGDGSFDPLAVQWDGTAQGAMQIVTAEYTRWCEGVRSLGEDGLFRPCGPAEGRFADEPYLTLVLHINREFLQHAAEVALMRDLYRDIVTRNNGHAS